MTSVNEVIESGIFSAATRLGSWSEWITPRNLGPVTSASLDVSNAQLHRLFTVNTVSRGRGYAMQGMVVEHKWTGDGLLLTGLCRGNGTGRTSPSAISRRWAISCAPRASDPVRHREMLA